MGSFGCYSCRAVLGAFAAVCARLFSLEMRDSEAEWRGKDFSRDGKLYPWILDGVAADFLLFGLWKVAGALNQVAMYPMRVASLPAVFRERKSVYALGRG